MTNRCVKYGQLLMIKGQQPDPISNQQIYGLLSTPGSFYDGITMQILNDVLTSDLSQNNPDVFKIKNFHDMIFILMPKMTTQIQKEYQKLLQQEEELQDFLSKISFKNQDQNQQFSQIMNQYSDLRIKIQQVESKIESEKIGNMRVLEQYDNQEVLYGQEFQLKHLGTGLYLAGSLKSSNSNISAHGLLLDSQEGNNQIFSKVFKIFPCYKYRNIGDPIQYEDQFQIFNIKFQSYLNFNSTARVEIDQEINPEILQQAVMEYENIELNCLTSQQYRQEAYLTIENQVEWEFIFYGIQNTGQMIPIQIGDFVRFKFPQLDGYLSADQKYQGDHSEAYVGVYKGDQKDEFTNANQIWIVENGILNNRCQDLVVKSVNTYNSTQYRLRHFLTGRLLKIQQKPTYQKNHINKQKIQSIHRKQTTLLSNYVVLANDDDPIDDDSLFDCNFTTVAENDMVINDKEFFILSLNKLYLTIRSDQQYFSNEESQVIQLNKILFKSNIQQEFSISMLG